MKVGTRRSSARSGHGTHWGEGGSKRTYLSKGDMIETQNSNRYVHRHRQNSRTRQGRSEATVLLHRSPDYSGEVVWGIPESTKGCQCWDRWGHVCNIRDERRRERPPVTSAAC